MAEDAIDQKKRVYDPQYDAPRKPGFRITRRGFLQGTAVVTAGTAIAGLARATVLAPDNEETGSTEKTILDKLIEKGIEPKEVYVGDIKITKGANGQMLNVRSATNTSQESLTTSWLNIEKFNGIDIKYINEFIVKNCLLVEGAYPDDPTGTKGEKGLWIVGNVGTDTLGVKNEGIKFISFSFATSSLVKTIEGGRFQNITRFDKDGITTEQGDNFKPDQIGLVIPLSKAA